MKLTIIILLLLTLPVMAQQQHVPHGEPSQDRECAAPNVQREHVQQVARRSDTSEVYAKINDCAQVFRGFESQARLRELRRERRDCLREVRKGKR